MSLTPKDKATVKLFWNKVASNSEAVGAEALSRMLTVYPQTKTYFSHWKDFSANSARVKKQGKAIMTGIGEAVAKMDDLNANLLTLSELHAFQLRVDPNNFKLLSLNIIVVLSIMFPEEFTPGAHVAVDKFLCALALALSEKYR